MFWPQFMATVFSFITTSRATAILPLAQRCCWAFVCRPNFNLPYRAVNIADFWRRWHITFSNWLRDYLYFALPGPRTRVMPYLNLVITMVLGGLWHGSNLELS